MLGMNSDFRKQILVLGDRRFRLRRVDGPIRRGGRELAYFVDHAAGVFELSNLLSEPEALAVMSAAATDYCRRLWRPIAVRAEQRWCEEVRRG